eukprot:TRINITY_DN274_c0_g1_i1.p1 TRINITY_DN274_c0_g1~~TRINITY_DN274_c0_g1_i1.p1  ORF type:complete len:317 (+),score=125.92 TRINITY_DN274_c0_g1_i1:47-997(+)
MAEENPTSVIDVETNEDFANYMATSGEKLVIIDFFATWCGPCKQIAPEFDKLSLEHPDILFLRVDIDKLKEIAATANVTSVPTFVFYREFKILSVVTGANLNQLKSLIEKNKNGGIDSNNNNNNNSSNDGIKYPTGQMNIDSYINKSRVNCLNQQEDNNVSNIFKDDDSFLESDCDEQLLLYIPFNQTVKVHSLILNCIEPANAPCVIKLFVNKEAMDFSSAETEKPTQVIELSEDQINDGSGGSSSSNKKKQPKLIPLKFVRFQKVNSLTIFVESNLDDEETTVIDQLCFIGNPGQVFNMNEFKRVSGDPNDAHI